MQTRWGLFAIPAAGALTVLFVAPQALLAIQSLHPNLAFGRVGTEWTLANYQRVFTDWHYLEALFRTVWLSFLTTVVCLLLGYPVAYFLARTRAWYRGILILVVIAPLLITIVVRSLGWIILLSDSGPLNYALLALSITSSPISLIYNTFGVVVGPVHAFLPMMIIILIGVVQQIDPSLEQAAADLGASRPETFGRVIIPLSLPGITAACILIFGVTSSVYTTTVMLGGGRVLTTPVQIAQEFQMTLNYPMASALSVVLAAVTFGLAMIGIRVTRTRYLETSL
jgi:putative spermidine/putrescine transport system permease protein